MHRWISSDGPVQSLPLPTRAGVSHALVRFRVPSPHVVLHTPYAVH